MRRQSGLFDLQKKRIVIVIAQEQGEVSAHAHTAHSNNPMANVHHVVAIEHEGLVLVEDHPNTPRAPGMTFSRVWSSTRVRMRGSSRNRQPPLAPRSAIFFSSVALVWVLALATVDRHQDHAGQSEVHQVRTVDQDLMTKCSSDDNGCRECDGSGRLWKQARKPRPPFSSGWLGTSLSFSRDSRKAKIVHSSHFHRLNPGRNWKMVAFTISDPTGVSRDRRVVAQPFGYRAVHSRCR